MPPGEMRQAFSLPKLPEEPYLLLSTTSPIAVKDSHDVRVQIEKFINGGCLTPVLGSETTDALTVPHQAVTRDHGFLAGLQEERSDDRLLRFHHALVAQRALGRVERDRDEPLSPADEALTRLRLALANAAWQATSLYARQWAEVVTPVSDWSSHGVDLRELKKTEDDDEPSIASLKGSLDSAVTFLEEFRMAQLSRESTDHRGALLGAAGLKQRLEHLSVTIEDQALPGTTVEWLTDVLWHVLMFDSPCYPTREELALQMSLGIDKNYPIRKVELTALTSGGVTQKWEPYRHAMSRTLTGLRGGSHAVPPVGDLHQALAMAMYHSFGRWNPLGTAIPRHRRRTLKRYPVPLAITLTTDLEFERALATCATGSGFYHVAFPMILTAYNQEEGGYLRWVIGKFETKPGSTKAEDAEADEGLAESVVSWGQLTCPVGPWQLLNSVAGEDAPALVKGVGGLEGPLLLKVNGSPLHLVRESLDDNVLLADGFAAEIESTTGNLDEAEARRDGRIRHVPATTELEIMQLTQVDQWAMGAHNGQAGLPPQIRFNLIEPARRWLLLGHDLHEWSSRLQLFTQISLSSLVTPGAVRAESTLALIREADEQRTRLLQGLGMSLTDYSMVEPRKVAEFIRETVEAAMNEEEGDASATGRTQP